MLDDLLSLLPFRIKIWKLTTSIYHDVRFTDFSASKNIALVEYGAIFNLILLTPKPKIKALHRGTK